MATTSRFSLAAVGWFVIYLLVWAGAVAVLSQAPGAGIEEPVMLFGVFGVVLPGVAWFLTRKARPPVEPVRRPALESLAVIAYLVLGYGIAFLGFGLTAVREAVTDQPAQELAVSALKIGAHVVLPSILLLALGARVAPLFRAGAGERGFWPSLIILGALLLALQLVASPSLKEINAMDAGPETLAWAIPGTFLWLFLSVGLCEEFLFRAVLQSRLTAWLKSATGAVVIGALLFGLAHAPGLYLRAEAGEFGQFDNPLYVAAYTIAILSPTGLFFGVLWARTRSLLLVVLLHVAVDFLPNLPDFVQSFR